MLNETKKEGRIEPLAAVTAAFAVFLMTVFLLWCHYYYTDIMSFRYLLYWASALIFSAVSLILMAVRRTKAAKCAGADEKNASGKMPIGTVVAGWFRGLALPWKILLTYYIVIVLSTVTSDYLYESFWGNEGRFTGLFLLSLYALTTVLIAKNWKSGPWILDVFCLGSLPVMIWGLTDFFNMDVFRFKAQYIADSAIRQFTSSIGNVNNYTAYVGIVLAVSAGLFCVTETLWKKIFYFAVLTLAFTALFTGQSDNAWISIGVIFAILPFRAFRTKKGVFSYVMVILAFLGAILWMRYISETVPVRNHGQIDGLIVHLIKIGGLKKLFWMEAVFCAIAGFFAYRAKTPEMPKGMVRLWGAFIALCAAGFCFVLYDANCAGHAERYAKLAQYLVFSDSWGTNRGIVWRISMHVYRELPFLKKLIGYGPETFGIVTYAYREETIEYTRQYFDAAHNEYIQLLLTIGVLGVVSYIAFMLASIREMLKSAERRPYIFAIAAGCIAYLSQASVNINLPIVAPILWLLIAVGLGFRRMDTEEQKSTAASDMAAAQTEPEEQKTEPAAEKGPEETEQKTEPAEEKGPEETEQKPEPAAETGAEPGKMKPEPEPDKEETTE